MANNYETPSPNVLEISTFCKKHKKKFIIFCKKHDYPCCRKCVVSEHQTCQDIIKLEDMVKNVKKSYGFRDIQQTMTDMLENIQRIRNDRQSNVSTLKEERRSIKKQIEHTRIEINAQLDKLQEGMMKELYEAESTESKMIGQLLDSIEKHEKEIREHQVNLIKIQQHASDLQAFLAMKQMERNLADKDAYFTSNVRNNKLSQVSLSCKMNEALQNIFKEIQRFGEVIVCASSCNLEIVRKNEKQAQIVVAPAPSKLIDNISVILQATIDTELDNITGCALLPDGKMVFSCFNKKLVRIFNRFASQDQDCDISLQSSFPSDITYLHDNNAIAVTGGPVQYISIIDVESRKVKENISVRSFGGGIVSRNNTLIYCALSRGIQMINLSDKSISNIVTGGISMLAYVTAFGDKLYYTNTDTHTVTCCDLHGTIQWEFKDKSVLRGPEGISVDNYGNVYVAGNWSNNVVVISPDGQRHKQLLSEKDGHKSPKVLDYDISTNELLVANTTGKAFLYCESNALANLFPTSRE